MSLSKEQEAALERLRNQFPGASYEVRGDVVVVWVLGREVHKFPVACLDTSQIASLRNEGKVSS